MEAFVWRACCKDEVTTGAHAFFFNNIAKVIFNFATFLVFCLELSGEVATVDSRFVGQCDPRCWRAEGKEVACAIAVSNAAGGIDAGDEFEGDLFGGKGFKLEALAFCEGVEAWITVLRGTEDVEALGDE